MTTVYRPKEMCEQLAVSPATLRRWSGVFASYLSPGAGDWGTDGREGANHRRYTDDDAALLATAKALMSSGYTYDEAARKLGTRRRHPQAESSAATADETPSLMTVAVFVGMISGVVSGAVSGLIWFLLDRLLS